MFGPILEAIATVGFLSCMAADAND